MQMYQFCVILYENAAKAKFHYVYSNTHTHVFVMKLNAPKSIFHKMAVEATVMAWMTHPFA